jgi:hypothetical protein
VKKISQLEDIKIKNQELQVLAQKLTQIIDRFNSELIISHIPHFIV